MVIDKVFIYKFLKFGIVGGSGVIVDFFFTWLFKRVWTFHSQNPEMLREYSEFLIISLIGLGINSAVLWFLTERIKLNFYVAKLGAIGVTTIWNFFANYLYTFA